MELRVEARPMDSDHTVLKRALSLREQCPEDDIVLVHNERELVLPAGVSRMTAWWEPRVFSSLLAATRAGERRSYAEVKPLLLGLLELAELYQKFCDSSLLTEQASRVLELLKLVDDPENARWIGARYGNTPPYLDWQELRIAARYVLDEANR